MVILKSTFTNKMFRDHRVHFEWSDCNYPLYQGKSLVFYYYIINIYNNLFWTFYNLMFNIHKKLNQVLCNSPVNS